MQTSVVTVVLLFGSTHAAVLGPPLDSSVVIERSFMCNMFQVALVNHQNPKRRCMFNVDEPVMQHNWTVSLKCQIEIVNGQRLHLHRRKVIILVPPTPTFSRLHSHFHHRAMAVTALAGMLNLPTHYDDLVALSPVVRKEVLTEFT